jgi:hypothetical protein
MERMLLVSASMMNRRALAFAIVLLLAGLAPASTIIGFCTRMPCCSHASDAAAAAFATERNDCCTTITCYDSPSAKLANGTSSSADAVLATPALPAVAAAPPVPGLTREIIDTSPPATARQRLAALSTLLI